MMLVFGNLNFTLHIFHEGENIKDKINFKICLKNTPEGAESQPPNIKNKPVKENDPPFCSSH